MARFQRRIKRLLNKLLTLIICLVILAGAAYYFYGMYGKGDGALRARERIEALTGQARSRTEGALDRLKNATEDLRARMGDTSADDENTTGALSEDLTKFGELLSAYEDQVGPELREDIARWRQKADEALSDLKSDEKSVSGDQIKDMLDSLISRIRKTDEEQTAE